MRVVASDEDEARGLATANMPNESKLEALDGTWSITRTMGGVWTVYIEGAADKAREMDHIEPHADIQWYESGEMAADAVSRGHHTAYGAAITEQMQYDLARSAAERAMQAIERAEAKIDQFRAAAREVTDA